MFPRGPERTEERYKERQHRKLLDEFFDRATLLAVSRLVNQGQFESIDFPISTGKEGGVFRATKGDEFRAVKIYRIGNTTFRHLPAYALEQLRRQTSVRNYGGLIIAWTRREHTILGRLADAGVRAPHPYGHLRNVLVMELIEDGGAPAPRLRDALIEDPRGGLPGLGRPDRADGSKGAPRPRRPLAVQHAVRRGPCRPDRRRPGDADRPPPGARSCSSGTSRTTRSSSDASAWR